MNYFPTSSQDSDFIVNRALMAGSSQRTDGRNDIYLLKTNAKGAAISAIAGQVRSAMPQGAVARVEDLEHATKTDESSLTSLNVTGLAGIERWFGYALAGGALLVFVATLLAQRRKDLSTVRALGASLGQVRGLVAIQAGTVTATALAIGVPIGLGMGWVMVRLLAIIFPIPVERTLFLTDGSALFLGGAVLAALAAIGAGSFALGRSSIGTVLREE